MQLTEKATQITLKSKYENMHSFLRKMEIKINITNANIH